MTTVEFQLHGKGMAHSQYITDLKTNHPNCIADEESVTLKLKMAMPQLFLAENLLDTSWVSLPLQLHSPALGGHAIITIIIHLTFANIDTQSYLVIVPTWQRMLRLLFLIEGRRCKFSRIYSLQGVKWAWKISSLWLWLSFLDSNRVLGFSSFYFLIVIEDWLCASFVPFLKLFCVSIKEKGRVMWLPCAPSFPPSSWVLLWLSPFHPLSVS